ncbi:MAG: serine/threonine-protein kinase [Polyangiales bacterium]
MGSTEPEPTLVGVVLAQRYRLVERLGGGGMGDVYRAVNEVAGREVAIKVLKPELARNPELVTRFVREARAANAVRHPNVVDVLDVAVDERNAPFIVQELLVGQDLSAHLRAQGRVLSPAAALDLMIPVCDALAAAHARGIMHRDLKPENIFLARGVDGSLTPKLLDFGLSRSVEAADQRLTATGMTMGTPYFMSPEQVQGLRDIGVRTDVWSLGVIFYELLSGRLPFTGESSGAIFVKICIAAPPAVDTVAAGLPKPLADLVMRCLERDPAKRFANAGEMVPLLRAMRGDAPTRPLAAVSAVPSPSNTLDVEASALGATVQSAPAAAPRRNTELRGVSVDRRVSGFEDVSSQKKKPLLLIRCMRACSPSPSPCPSRSRRGSSPAAPGGDRRARGPRRPGPRRRTSPRPHPARTETPPPALGAGAGQRTPRSRVTADSRRERALRRGAHGAHGRRPVVAAPATGRAPAQAAPAPKARHAQPRPR